MKLLKLIPAAAIALTAFTNFEAKADNYPDGWTKLCHCVSDNDEFYNFAGVIVFVDGYLFQEEQSGGWFTELQNEQGRDPRDFQDFVEENQIKWRRDLLNEIGLQ